MITDKITALNPKINIIDVIETEGDYVVFVGQMGEDDVPHYFAANHKYGVIEASCSTFKETANMLAFVSGGEEPAKKRKQIPMDFN